MGARGSAAERCDDRVGTDPSPEPVESPRRAFLDAQQRMLDRYGVEAESRLVDVPSIGGRAHALVSGDGPAVVLVDGIGTPAALFAPLMAELAGFRLFAVDLPGYGLTDAAPDLADDLRHNAVRFLVEATEGLGLGATAFVASSLGSLWTSWLALDRPDRVKALVHVGCPAVTLDASAPLPMRLLSVRPLGRLLTRLQPPSPGQVEQLGRMVGQHPLPPEAADLLLATERLPGFRETFLSTLHALLRLRGSRPRMRLDADQLARIRAPALVFWGDAEPFGAPELGRRIAEAMPSAALHDVAGGHAPWLTDARRIAETATGFLRQHA